MKIFGIRNRGRKAGTEVWIIGEREDQYIVVDEDGWSLASYDRLEMGGTFYYSDTPKSTDCLFVCKIFIDVWHHDTKLGKLL